MAREPRLYCPNKETKLRTERARAFLQRYTGLCLKVRFHVSRPAQTMIDLAFGSWLVTVPGLWAAPRCSANGLRFFFLAYALRLLG